MIADEIKTEVELEDRNGVIIGGNMVRWYGGFDSYVIAQEFDTDIFAPSMGRKIDREDEMDINHLPYMDWLDWQTELSKHKYGVHLMPTHAAGTFALNCSYHGIPCIGYDGLDTQSELHPDLTVSMGDLKTSNELVYKLKNDKDFYTHCSKKTKLLYKNMFFTEKEYIYSMNNIIKEVFDENN